MTLPESEHLKQRLSPERYRQWQEGRPQVRSANVAEPQPNRRSPRKAREPIEVRGPALWTKLHQRPREWPGGDDTAWLQAFRREVGCGACVKDYDAFVKEHPPTFDSAKAYAMWTLQTHNHVNAALGRREWTWDEFARHWGY